MANLLESVGERTIEQLDYVGSLNIQWWATVRAMAQSLPFVGNRYRWKTTVRQMLEIGVDAIPMVSLMAVCTGFIFAMQGASELRRFGALRYVVDLVAVGSFGADGIAEQVNLVPVEVHLFNFEDGIRDFLWVVAVERLNRFSICLTSGHDDALRDADVDWRSR
jgi:hypothetical protein